MAGSWTSGFLCLLCPCVGPGAAAQEAGTAEKREQVWAGSSVQSDVGLSVVL